ncbi:MAG: hypothetical protein K2K57_08215 [Oscillospiraceae bacterium]|nr:hypothetical protein [Oscillospiraceae bacterium]
MNPWTAKNHTDFYLCSQPARGGLQLHFYGGVCPAARAFLCDFAKWLRKKFEFPVRINVYIKNTLYIKARDGECVSATFFGPFDKTAEPYAKIAVGDYSLITEEYNVFSALCSIAASLAHELTHYYQWLNGLNLSEKQEERQARYYSEKTVYKYLDEQGYDFLELSGISTE